MNDRDRFWSFVRKRARGQCWPWKGAHSKRGQGMFWLDGVMVYAHRAAWVLSRGPVPARHRVVHTCTSALSLECCNPSHLMCVGTKPKLAHTAKSAAMTAHTLIDLRRALSLTQADVARMLRVHVATLSRWENGRSPISPSRADHIRGTLRTAPDATS